MPDPHHAALAEQLHRQQRTLHAVKALMTRGTPEAEQACVALLLVLAERGPLRVSALAEAVHADPSTVSRQSAQLVTLGLVERRPDPDDGRASRLAVTAGGRRHVSAVNARRLALLQEALTGWDQEEVRLLTESMQRFTTSLERVRHELAEGTSPLLRTSSPAPSPAGEAR